MFKNSTARLCFIGTILLGFGFLLIGLVVIPFRPVFELDVVLTPDQLDDELTRESTLEMLKKASGNEWIIWTLCGFAQLAIGVLGLLSVSRPIDQQVSNDHSDERS